MGQAYSVITHAGDGLDHEVLDADIATAIKTGTQVGYPALCPVWVVPEVDLANRLGRRCADCLDARATLDPPLRARTEPGDLEPTHPSTDSPVGATRPGDRSTRWPVGPRPSARSPTELNLVQVRA